MDAALAMLAVADKKRNAALQVLQGEIDKMAGTKAFLEDQTDENLIRRMQGMIQRLVDSSNKNRADYEAGEAMLRAQVAALVARTGRKEKAAEAGLQALSATLSGIRDSEAAMKKSGSQGLASVEDQFAQGDEAYRSRLRDLGRQSDDNMGQIQAALNSWIGEFGNGAADVASSLQSANATSGAALDSSVAEALAALHNAQQLQQRAAEAWADGAKGLERVGNNLVAAGQRQASDTARALAGIKAAEVKEASDFGEDRRAEDAAQSKTTDAIDAATLTLASALHALNSSVRADDAGTLAPSFVLLRALQAAASAAHDKVAATLGELSRQASELDSKEAGLRTARNSTYEGLDDNLQGLQQSSEHGLQAAEAALLALRRESATAEATLRTRMARERTVLDSLRTARIGKELQQMSAVVSQRGAVEEAQLDALAADNRKNLDAAFADLTKMIDAQDAATDQAEADARAGSAAGEHGLAKLQGALVEEVQDLLQRLKAVGATYRSDFAQLAATRDALDASERAMESQVAATLAAKESAVVGDVDGAVDSAGSEEDSSIQKDVDDVRGRVPPWIAATGAKEQQLRGSVGASADAEAQQDAADAATNRSIASGLDRSGEELRGRLSQVGPM